MKIEIKREYFPKETLGEFYIDGKLITQTIELPILNGGNQVNKNCIPEGTYTVKKELTSAHHNYPHFRFQNVPKRIGILIHRGNYVRELLGCVAPGLSRADLDKDGLIDVAQSTKALELLYDLLPEEFQITISKK